MNSNASSLQIIVKGVVQGVGFRPFVYSLAKEMSLRGFVINTSQGVLIIAEGRNLQQFIERLRKEAPPLSKITSIDISPITECDYQDFSIRKSSETGSFTLLSPDISVCEDCIGEMFDTKDRRYLYPFINCTNCGPRYSITESVPYDRCNTTMNIFPMCQECSSEYNDPLNRRFHAQPNACERCGPAVSLLDRSGTVINDRNSVASAIELLRDGKIIAIKGLGGFHIACDALNNEAVNRLRSHKRRNNKPFALMAPDVAYVKKFCNVSDAEKRLLLTPGRPIVLLNKRSDISLPEGIAPLNRCLGFMLPYTPLHYLLFHYPFTHHSSLITKHCFDALVMTSGNISEEPILISNQEAVQKLGDMVDAFLVHNRDIFMRVDDSVVRAMSDTKRMNSTGRIWNAQEQGSMAVFRRSRGYAPEAIQLGGDGPEVLGCGADVKNTFTLTKGDCAVMSQHIGDMENYETLAFFEETLRNLKTVYRVKPEAVAYDLHPGYISTKWALEKKNGLLGEDIRAIGIQHHYAHIASVMAEKGIREKVIGVAFDGNGYGTDGSLWGGEFLIADIAGFKRAGHIKYIPLPGGEAAVREPWRMALSYIKDATGSQIMDYLEPTGFAEKYGEKTISNILMIAGNRQFSPLSSGAGRLFDAVSAIIGICDRNTFEGEASIALESLVLEDIEEDYPADIGFHDVMDIDFSHTILRILQDIKAHEDRHIIATKFHNTVATAIIRVVLKLSLMNNIKKVILSGGVFQNLYLLKRVINGLQDEALSVYINQRVPCNDAGISLGQAYIARERLKADIK